MQTIDIKTPDGKTITLNAPDGATQAQVSQAAQNAVAHYKSTMQPQQPQQPAQPQQDMASMAADASNPQNMLASAAPSNVLSAAGVAAANAPGVASAVVNSIPGMGNPAAIMPALANIAQNPGQAGQAANRVIQTQGGAPTQPGDESTLATAGKVAGTVMEGAGPAGLNKGVKPGNAFTTGFSNPQTAVPGYLNKANTALKAAKAAAKVGDDPEVASALRAMVSTPDGVAKLANKAIDDIATKGPKLSTTELLYYRQALGQMQAKGGEAAGDYKDALDEASSLLKARAPKVSDALAKSRLGYQAQGGDEFKFPTLPMAISPGLGAARLIYNTMKAPLIANTAGAVAGAGSPALPSMSDMISQGFSRLQKRKKG